MARGVALLTNGPVSTLPAYVAAEGRDDSGCRDDRAHAAERRRRLGARSSGAAARRSAGRRRSSRRAPTRPPQDVELAELAADLVTTSAEDVGRAARRVGHQLRAARAGGASRSPTPRARCGCRRRRRSTSATRSTRSATPRRARCGGSRPTVAARPAAPADALALARLIALGPARRRRDRAAARLPTAASRRAARRTPRVVGPHWQGGPMSDRRVFRWATTSARLLAGDGRVRRRRRRRRHGGLGAVADGHARAGQRVGDARARRERDRRATAACSPLGRDLEDAARDRRRRRPRAITSGVSEGAEPPAEAPLDVAEPRRRRRARRLHRAARRAAARDGCRGLRLGDGRRRRPRRVRGIRLPPAAAWSRGSSAARRRPARPTSSLLVESRRGAGDGAADVFGAAGASDAARRRRPRRARRARSASSRSRASCSARRRP